MSFEDRIRNSGFKILNPMKNKEGDILLAQRYNRVELMWEMLWCIKRGDEDIGRTVFFLDDEPLPIRLMATKKDAENFIAENLKVGRYGNSQKSH